MRRRALATAIALAVTAGVLDGTVSHAGTGVAVRGAAEGESSEKNPRLSRREERHPEGVSGESSVQIQKATAGGPRGIAAETVPYASMIHATATRYGLPPQLVEAVIRAESNFEARAVSPKGAMGLMQLMPGTAAMLGVRNAFDVKQNLEGGVRHLVDLLYRFSGNLRLALAAYNAGEETVRRHGGVPPYPETIGYVERIVASYERRAGQRGSSHARTPGPAAAMATSTGTERAVAAVASVPPEPDRSVVYRYETEDGAVVFTNVPPRLDSPPARSAASPPTSW